MFIIRCTVQNACVCVLCKPYICPRGITYFACVRIIVRRTLCLCTHTYLYDVHFAYARMHTCMTYTLPTHAYIFVRRTLCLRTHTCTTYTLPTHAYILVRRTLCLRTHTICVRPPIYLSNARTYT